MKKTPLSTGLLAGVLFLSGPLGEAQAAPVITLTSLSPTVTVGDLVTFELWMDFTGDPTLGGDINIVYTNFTDGNQLNLVSYTPYLGNPDYQPGVPGDPALTSAPLPDPGGLSGTTMAPSPTPSATGLSGIAVGDFVGIDGQYLIGTLLFQAKVAGGAYTLAAQDAGGFFSISGPAQPVQYDNLGAAVTVDPAAVPLPATAWLLLSGLGGLSGFAKRRRAA